jgi:hypothetical protein
VNFGDFIRDSSEAARALVDNPGQKWRRGMGIASPEEELAAVLHYARKGFPQGGKSLTIQAPWSGTPLYRDLLNMAKEMQREGILDMDENTQGYIFVGKPHNLREAMRLTMRRKPELLADAEQHREVGRLLGYDEDAIEDFIREFERKNRLRNDT